MVKVARVEVVKEVAARGEAMEVVKAVEKVVVAQVEAKVEATEGAQVEKGALREVGWVVEEAVAATAVGAKVR